MGSPDSLAGQDYRTIGLLGLPQTPDSGLLRLELRQFARIALTQRPRGLAVKMRWLGEGLHFSDAKPFNMAWQATLCDAILTPRSLCGGMRWL